MDTSLISRWKHRGRFVLKGIVIGALSLLLMLLAGVLVLVAFLAFENWRGHRAWEKFTAECEAAGESLRPEAVIPPPVPDEENFAAIPLFAPLFDYTLDRTKSRRRPVWRNAAEVERLDSIGIWHSYRIEFPQVPFDWQHGKLFDAPAWQAYLRHDTNIVWPAELRSPSEDILFALSKHDDDLKQLHAARDRPKSRFPLKYEEGFEMVFLHLDVLRNLVLISSTRALVHLSAEDSDSAFKEVLLAIKLGEAVAGEPLVISQLNRQRNLQRAVQVVWEGLTRRAWTEAHLVRFDGHLATIDLLASYKLAVQGQLSLITLPYLEWEGQRQPYSLITGFGAIREEPPTYPEVKSLCVPQGIRRLYEMPVSRWMHRLLTLADSRTRVFRVEEASELLAEHSSLDRDRDLWRLGYDLQVALNMTAEFSFVRRCTYNQSTVDLCRVAIALERHRLQQGSFPESLDALAPDVRPAGGIPLDVINGEPLRYRRTDDGRFQLYSLGWNQTDEGGTPSWLGINATPDPVDGDWVWPQPAPSP